VLISRPRCQQKERTLTMFTHLPLKFQLLASGHGADDQKWFLAVGDRIGQLGVRRFQGKILSTSIEPNKRTPLQSQTIANRAPEHRVTAFERVENRSQGSSPLNDELHFLVHSGQGS